MVTHTHTPVIQCNPNTRELSGPGNKSLISGFGLFYLGKHGNTSYNAFYVQNTSLFNSYRHKKNTKTQTKIHFQSVFTKYSIKKIWQVRIFLTTMNTIFKVFDMTRFGIEPRSPGIRDIPAYKWALKWDIKILAKVLFCSSFEINICILMIKFSSINNIQSLHAVMISC